MSDIFSTFAAVGSFATAFLTYNHNKNKDKKNQALNVATWVDNPKIETYPVASILIANRSPFTYI